MQLRICILPLGAVCCWSKYLFSVNCLLFPFYLAHSDAVTNISCGGIFKSINEKMHVGGIFCDWAKASDCMNDETLLAKLHFYGI